MDYDQWWKALDHLIAEFRRKRIVISPETMKALKSAKTMIKVYGADTSRFEPVPAIESYLLEVESTLLNIAKKKFGVDFVDLWLKKLQKARKSKPEVGNATQRFISGLPKNQHWIRIQPSDEILEKDVGEMVSELGLSSRLQQDGHLLVYGPREALKELVKRMARKIQETKGI